MDGFIKILFIQENTLAGSVIQAVTGGQWSHVAVLAFDGLVEAVPPRVAVSSSTRYANNITEKVDFYVTDIDAALAELKRCIGMPYNLLACLSGGLYDTFHIQLPDACPGAVDCCELVVKTIRAGGGKVESGLSADCFTPQTLYAALKLKEN